MKNSPLQILLQPDERQALDRLATVSGFERTTDYARQWLRLVVRLNATEAAEAQGLIRKTFLAGRQEDLGLGK